MRDKKDTPEEIRVIEQQDRGFQLTELGAQGIDIPDSIKLLQQLIHGDIIKKKESRDVQDS